MSTRAEPGTRAEPAEAPTEHGHRAVLHAAVAEIGGAERPGQVEMADAIAEAFQTGRHLLVQAGTGTGKSLGYLAPACSGSWLPRTSRPPSTPSSRSPESDPGTRS